MHSSPPATAKRDLLVAIENHVGCFGGWFILWVRLVIVEMAMMDLVLRVTLVNTVWCLDGWLCLWVRMVILVSVVKNAFSRWFRRDNGCVLGFDCKSVKTKLGRVEFRIWPQWCGISKLRIDWVKFGIWFISIGVLTSEGESLLVQHASGGGFNRESWGVGVWMIFQRKRFNMRFNGFQRVEMGVLFLLLEVHEVCQVSVVLVLYMRKWSRSVVQKDAGESRELRLNANISIHVVTKIVEVSSRACNWDYGDLGLMVVFSRWSLLIRGVQKWGKFMVYTHQVRSQEKMMITNYAWFAARWS